MDTTGNTPAPVGPSAPLTVRPVPITPVDRCAAAGGALAAAAAQLRDHAAVPSSRPPELTRERDLVGAGTLYAVAEWLDARAGLYGVPPEDATEGFDQ